ncbi:MAG TPA: hypothetical protein VMY76_16795 [Gemmatimonadales bacterium]|nr:hypothetical protein [Gemmatimonadales bacterium]
MNQHHANSGKFGESLGSPIPDAPRPGRLMRSTSAAVLIIALAVRPLAASIEEPITTFRASGWQPAPFTLRYTVPAEGRRDYRWAGTAVIGAGLGVAAAFVSRAACGNSERGPRDCTGVTIGVGLLGAAVGGVIGNLLGRLVHRH